MSEAIRNNSDIHLPSQATEQARGQRERFLEYVLVVTLSAIPFVMFYSTRLKSSYDHISILLLVIWYVLLRGKTLRKLPKYLIIAAIFYAVSFLISAAISEHREFKLPEINSLRIPFLAGLLFIQPFRIRSRKIIMTVFLTVASTVGIIALFQYTGFLFPQSNRPYGPVGVVCMPGIYAGMLSFACGAAIIMSLVGRKWSSRLLSERVFLTFVILSTAAGILLFQSRGVWIAFIMALTATIYFYDKRKAVITALALLVAITTLLSFSSSLRNRAVSIITSVYTEDENGSTGNRFELWKASWMIFKNSPIFGTGLWDYQSDVQELIREGWVANVPVTFHAHNIYLHNMATRGIVGFFATTAMFAALLTWGRSLIRKNNGEGGYIIIFSTLIMMIGGLTDTTFADGAPYAFAYWYTIGLFGPCSSNEATINTKAGKKNEGRKSA